MGDAHEPAHLTPIADAIAGAAGTEWVPVTYEDHDPPLWGLAGKGLRPAPGGLDEDAEYQKAAALC